MTRRKVVVKKYSDRRLYDSEARRYVTLGDIAQMIREGADVEVVDAATGKDLTRVVLTQIIVEGSREGDSGLPLKLLRQLVVSSDRGTHDFLSWYLEAALDLYKKAGAAVRSGVSEVRHLVGPAAREEEFEKLRHKVAELEARIVLFEQRRRASRKKTQ